MLNRFEILGGLGGAYLAAIVIYVIAKRIFRNKLPPGSIVTDKALSETPSQAPGSRWSQLGTSTALGFGSFFTIITLILSIFDWWNFVPLYFFVDLPPWVNWMGIAGFLVVCVWAIAVMTYNVNYTPAFQGIKGKYVLATGGPYKWMRHPMYVGKIAQAFCIFFVTGLWPILFTILFWGAVRQQAIAEEEAMRILFGARYEEYIRCTGRFLPKVRQLKS